MLAGAALTQADDLYHTVKSGETLFSLARQYGVKEADIMFINSLSNANKIYAGQKLRIPAGSISASPFDASGSSASSSASDSSDRVSGNAEYRAVAGDTLYGIARKHGITYSELNAANNFPGNYVLKAGDKIKLPSPAKSSGSSNAAQNSGGKNTNGNSATQNAPVRNVAPVTPAKPAAKPSPTAPKSNNNAIDRSLEWPVMPKESAYMTGKLSGIVLTGEKTEPVHSVSSGTVVSAGPYRGFGRVVIIKSDKGYDYVYGGCESLTVRKGDRVVAGSEVGKLGIDAVSSKPQLYFMVYQNSKPVDPAKAPRA
jgi:murein DD-endopeptidase MepM/ murein hydrolase activator NlpD